MRVLLPPRDVDEEPRLEVRHHHIRQVRDRHVCQVRHASFRMPFASISFHLVSNKYLLLNSPGRSTSLAFACTVDSLRCWNQAGRGETIPTSCSSGLFQREIHKKRNMLWPGMKNRSRTRRRWLERLQTSSATPSLSSRFRQNTLLPSLTHFRAAV